MKTRTEASQQLGPKRTRDHKAPPCITLEGLSQPTRTCPASKYGDHSGSCGAGGARILCKDLIRFQQSNSMQRPATQICLSGVTGVSIHIYLVPRKSKWPAVPLCI